MPATYAALRYTMLWLEGSAGRLCGEGKGEAADLIVWVCGVGVRWR